MQTQKTMLLLGCTSDIGLATAVAYGDAGYRLIVTARVPESAERNVRDIKTRTGAEVDLRALDILHIDQFEGFVDRLPVLPDTVICVIGELGDQQRAQRDVDHASTVMRTNFEGPALLLGLFAERMSARGWGTLVGVSSVAGDRGRASNYVYGAAKAGFTAFLSGLRNRLAASRVRVVTIKPGYVHTRMTQDMKLPSALTAEPDEVGRVIYRAAENGRADVLYVRPIWRIIMAVIRVIPERLFKRLRL
ncbi:SDR family oxidoreductase [Bradyrhizobium sp. ORS 86]|uniref:SDR family oxidoreductase n=1 Tax=Bradyrhizobium sp. ORS 86 TaxID=1685970 RepID=UPI0038907BA2